MCTARPESPSWPGVRLHLAWAHQMWGPPGQGAGIITPGTSRSPRGRKGLTPGSWRAPDRQGPTKQLVTITNSGREQRMQLFTRT